jgi:hypothetical protein
VREGKHPGAKKVSDPWNVDENHNKRSFKEQREVSLVVNHELLAKAKSSCLGDNQVSLLEVDD